MTDRKPVILLIIDTLMPTPLEEAVQTGRAPALQFFMKHGKYFPHMVSSFPTISISIDSTLLTGTYPDRHHIPGLVWFDEKEKRIVNHGMGIRGVFKTGPKQFVRDMFVRLNNEELSSEVRTIHEELAEYGKSTASINSFVYRGNTPHRMHLPRLLTAFTSLDKEWQTKATEQFSLGALSKLRPISFVPQMLVGNYKFSIRELKYLIRTGQLPSFTMCVIQDLDLRIHFKGPMDLKGIEKIDREMQKILHLYPSWEEAIQQNIWIVLSDNGQASMGSNRKQFLIDLRKKFRSYRMAKLKQPVTKRDQMVFSVNQRMAYIYVLDRGIPLSNMIAVLQRDERIDLIAWKEGQGVHVVSGEKEGQLSYQPEGKHKDIYGQSWQMEGDTKLLDVSLREDGHLEYGDYPDALARLYGALFSHDGRYLVVNAKPGCEFKAEATSTHLGGAAHGSLHKQESLVPMIVSGTDVYPEHQRIVDLKEWILRLV